jgi:toxin ParE1/3/4
MKVFWTSVAYRRLEEIYRYIEKDSPDNAARWSDRLLKKLATIKDFPRAGRPVPEIDAPGVREIIYGNYRIIYKIKSEAAYILTIRHFKQILPMKELEE